MSLLSHGMSGRMLVIAPVVCVLIGCSVGEGSGGTRGLSFTSAGNEPEGGSTTGAGASGPSTGADGTGADGGSSGGAGEGTSGDGATSGGTGSSSGISGGATTTGSPGTTGATSTTGTTAGSSTGGSTGGVDEDPGYPRPDGAMCPAGFALLHVLNGGSLCTLECPNDGATTCPAALTGDADPWCSFPSEVASNQDCTMSGTCADANETCVAFVGVSLCRDDKSRCGLWCGANEKTCPDGMTCQADFCGY